MFEVSVHVDGDSSQTRKLTGESVSVGRSADWAQLLIAHKTVSRKHAKLISYSGSWILEAIKPVHHNGRPPEVGPVLLADGDRVALSAHVELRFRDVDPDRTRLGPGGGGRPNARLLSDIIVEAEQEACGIAVLRRIGFPVLITGSELSVEKAGSTAVYPLGDMAAARRDSGRRPHIRIGRGEASDVLVASDVSVSKRHALLVDEGGEDWSLACLSKRAVTLLDGEPVQSGRKVVLQNDVAHVKLGSRTAFTFFREAGFRILFQRLLASRLCARQAGTVEMTGALLADETPDLSETARVILDAAAPGRDAVHFRVALDNALLEEANSWRDLTDLVAELDQHVVSIEARLPDGSRRVVYDRS